MAEQSETPKTETSTSIPNESVRKKLGSWWRERMGPEPVKKEWVKAYDRVVSALDKGKVHDVATALRKPVEVLATGLGWGAVMTDAFWAGLLPTLGIAYAGGAIKNYQSPLRVHSGGTLRLGLDSNVVLATFAAAPSILAAAPAHEFSKFTAKTAGVVGEKVIRITNRITRGWDTPSV